MARKTEKIDPSTQLETQRHTVSFDSYDITVRQLMDMIDADSVDISPEYQRHFVWDSERQSTFIESVFLGIPVPPIFMATNKDSTWELVDGVQRISSLINYCGSDKLRKRIKTASPLSIIGLEKLDSFNDLTYDALPKSLQLAFQLRPIRVTTLNDKSSKSVRFDLFERLNTGGIKLQPQEIRNCIFRGEFNKSIKTLSGNATFRKVAKVQKGSENNGTSEELVLRYFAFLSNYSKFDHSVNDFLNGYMEANQNKKIPAPAIEEFNAVFEILSAALPNGITRTPSGKITPFNLFEAIAVGTALALRLKKSIKKANILPLLTDLNLKKFTTGGTNSNRMVVGRIEYVRDRLV